MTNLAENLQPRVQSGKEYDEQWSRLDGFIRYNPGARHRRRLMVDMLKGASFSTVLDVGCGPGEGMMTIQKNFPSVHRMVGADFAPDVIDRNRETLPTFEFLELDITESFLGEQFDLVVCSEVLEHLDKRSAAFANLVAMVKVGGYLLVTCPTGKMYPTEISFGHVSHPSREELAELGSSCGLSVERLLEWGFPTYRVLKEAVNVNPSWSVSNFGDGVYSKSKIALNNLLYWVTYLNIPLSGQGCQLFCLYKKQN